MAVAFTAEPRVDHFQIHIEQCIFGGRYAVVVRPHSCEFPMREFRSLAEAEAFSRGLARHQGWPIVDRTGQ